MYSKADARKFQLLVALILCSFSSAMASQYVTMHTDYRDTVKVLVLKQPFQKRSLKSEDLIKIFLENNLDKFAMKNGFEDLVFKKKRSGLTLVSYHYKQKIHGVDVENSQVIFSLNKTEDKILQIYNNYHPVDAPIERNVPSISVGSAFDITWMDLRPTGELIDQPQSSTVYHVTLKGELKLVQQTYLALSEPLGDWKYLIDATTGEILEAKNQMLEKTSRTLDAIPRNKGSSVFRDRVSVFAGYESKMIAKSSTDRLRAKTAATASAFVFDPDPRTSLKDNSLRDNSDAADFSDAYVRVDLLGMEFKDGVYSFNGPWVRLEDFDTPDGEVTSSETGVWESKRGENGFNDAMTYYHLDKNQRYIQSLGFRDETGIQFGSIVVDSDGAYGADNSFFSPRRNTISFGHGCIDDNEDADVILHEYGHAIQASINTDWEGGDTGAMGEGFGDYWAGSYSLSKLDEDRFEMYRVFNWDGSDDCWSGRILNATKLKYDTETTYRAHARLSGGRVTDELWSTPLFTSLVELVNQNIPREEVDKAILEGHFGLGSGLKMPDLALATVAAARRLYPEGPHAQVLEKNFKKQMILSD